MAKAFFFKDTTLLTWKYGSFNADGVTPEVEYTLPAGLYRARWQMVDSVAQLTIVNSNNQGELFPINAIPIGQLASDLIGTPYANKAAFETANAAFFFRVGGLGSGGSTGKFNQPLTGLQNDENLIYTTPDQFKLGSTRLFQNGGRLIFGVDYTETNGNTVTLTIAPDAAAVLKIDYDLVVSVVSTNKDIYHVILNQTGTNAPTVLVYEDTVSGVVVTRSAVGTYLFTKVGAFPVGKCSPAKATQGNSVAGDKLVLTPVSADVYKLETYAAVNDTVLADGVLVNQEIIIEIYKI